MIPEKLFVIHLLTKNTTDQMVTTCTAVQVKEAKIKLFFLSDLKKDLLFISKLVGILIIQRKEKSCILGIVCSLNKKNLSL